MADKPINRVVISDWPGLASGFAPHGIGSGAQVQENATSSIPGRLACRLGMVPLTFFNGSTEDTQNAIYAYGLQRPDRHFVIYFTDSGEWRAGHTPVLQ